jgi:NAD(P)-dependent dehydrogenase (short-subunit alcohol dehydrogenase family)
MQAIGTRLKDKVVIVTGGTSGIGAAIARLVVREGGKVLVTGIVEAEGKALVAELGANSALSIADLVDPASPKKIVADCLAAFGRIDSLVNCAATFDQSNIETLDYENYLRLMQINLNAPLFLIQACFPELKKNKGAVLNIGSVNAHAGEANLLAYSMSKGAMVTMTRNLGNANGVHGVRINQINPGWILTEREKVMKVQQGMKEGWWEHLPKSDAPFGKMSTPEQLAAGCIYWISDESIPFTATVLDLEQFSFIGRNPEKN